MYKSKSSKARDTLYQIQSLLNKTSVPIDPAHNMKDFLRVVLFAHIVAASKTVVSSDKLSITEKVLTCMMTLWTVMLVIRIVTRK